MPENVFVWIVLIVAGAIVLLVALKNGRFVSVRIRACRQEFKRNESSQRGIRVGRGVKLSNSTIGGDIAAVKVDPGGLSPETGTSASVLDGATVEDSKVQGDIVGVKQSTAGNGREPR